MHIFSSDGQSRLSAHVRALPAVGLGIYAAHLVPPVVVIILVALAAAVVIALVFTAVFWNPDVPPGVSAGWLLCVLLRRPYQPPRRETGPARGRGSAAAEKGGREKPR